MNTNSNQTHLSEVASTHQVKQTNTEASDNKQASKSGIALLKQSLKRSWTRWRAKRNTQISEDIFAYRTMALQLIHDKANSPSLLLVSANRVENAAHSCVLLTMALSSVLKRSVLIIDVTIAGSSLPELLGCTSRAGESVDIPPEAREKRFFEEDLGWFFKTREGITVGPFLSLADAKLELERYIENDLFETPLPQEQFATNYIMPSKSESIDYLSAVSAGLHASLENKSEDFFMKEIASLIEEVHEKYEYIVFFGGYLLDCPTGMKVAPQVGKVVLSTTENLTSQEEYRSAVKTLRLCGVEHFNNMLVKISGRALSSSLRSK
ncbi:DUF6316 family protein [Paraglaciecola sp. MB-3u-78]|jgi:hypothetical protein|uniref:DUF6316 family protein n=1 Tax=Paraglaciecola sp. MB-3u-78 TaxID=2058332 RepID=UPI000C3474DD|nr:DUF6316 family protein [Paraglaciecola sp. MB-3u-78]PKG93213.1 hypothetical protein CXF95_26900 [Paraglaciecola sp. MB-3u-78]